MSAPPPGWYPDPIERAGLRYFDGTAWTQHRQAGPPVAYQYGPYGAAPRRGMSAGGIVAIVIGSFLVLGMLASMAIPVFLNQRRVVTTDLGWITCDNLAADAVTFSSDIEAPGGALLTYVDDLVMIKDARPGLRLPADGLESSVLACSGTGVWEDGTSAPISIELTIDSREELYVAYWRL